MTVVVYKCDVCKREKQSLRNEKGLDVVLNCTITLGCRGKLHQSSVHLDYIRTENPTPVDGLDDWQQRVVLFNFSQPIESNVWSITHNLGTFPSISVFVNTPTTNNELVQQEITPDDVVIINSDQLELHFNKKWAGIAQLVSRGSDPDLLHPNNQPAVTTEPTTEQITANSYLTIALRNAIFSGTSTLTIDVDYVSNTGLLNTFTYTVTPDIQGAWKGISRINIKGKSYTLWQTNITLIEMTTGAIQNGSVVRIRAIRTNTNDYVVDQSYQVGSPLVDVVEPGDVLMLLSNSPYNTVDINKDNYIDIKSVTPTVNPSGFYYSNFELISSSSLVQSTYPPIKTF